MTNLELALELQKLAVHLQDQPEVEIGDFRLYNRYGATAEEFKNLARVMPKPLNKRVDEGLNWLYIENDNVPLQLCFYIERSNMCRIIKPAQPAVYECEPLMSADEEAALEG